MRSALPGRHRCASKEASPPAWSSAGLHSGIAPSDLSAGIWQPPSSSSLLPHSTPKPGWEMEEQSLEHISVTWHALLNETLRRLGKVLTNFIYISIKVRWEFIPLTDMGTAIKAVWIKQHFFKLQTPWGRETCQILPLLSDLDPLAGMWTGATQIFYLPHAILVRPEVGASLPSQFKPWVIISSSRIPMRELLISDDRVLGNNFFLAKHHTCKWLIGSQ